MQDRRTPPRQVTLSFGFVPLMADLAVIRNVESLTRAQPAQPDSDEPAMDMRQIPSCFVRTQQTAPSPLVRNVRDWHARFIDALAETTRSARA